MTLAPRGIPCRVYTTRMCLSPVHTGLFLGVRSLNRRIGVVGIVIEDRNKAPEINNILSLFSEIIIGRMGIPHRERGLSVISLIVEGTNDEIGAMTGKLGNIKGVQVKSALSTKY